MSTLWFEPVGRGRHHVTLRYGVDDMRFTTTYWYDDVDFDSLERRYGADLLRLVEFHLLAFEANTGGQPGTHGDRRRPVRRSRHGRLLGPLVDDLPPCLGRLAARERLA